MATATSTTIELQQLPEQRQSRLNQTPTITDDIDEASRLVDSGPEGGYGWVSLAACCVLVFWFVGTTYSWGIIQGALVANKTATASILSWVGSITVACNAIFAILSANVLRRLGSRYTALCGIVLLALGQILASFCIHNIGGLFVTEGFVMGAGVSLCFIVAGSNPAQYFNRRRGVANGIVFAAGGLGGAVISFMMAAFIESLDTAWTLRIIGGMTLATGIPAAWFIRDRVPPSRRKFVDWQLFKDFRFVVLFLAGAVATFPLLVPPFFLPLYAVSMGLSAKTAAAMVAAWNGSSGIGRIAAGFAADRIGPLNCLATTLFLNGLSMVVLWPYSTSLAPLIAFSLINGAMSGGFFSLMPTVAGQVFGSARVALALGMLVSGWSFGYLLGSPIAALLLAAYGGQSAGLQAYRPAMYYASSLSIGAAGLVALVRLRMSTKMLKKL